MPVLVDFSQVCISVVFQNIDKNGNLKHRNYEYGDGEVNENLSVDLMRHVLLSNILYFKRRFEREYGEFIYCIDHKDPWRRQVFEYYKYNRKRIKEDSLVDWDMIRGFIDHFRDELREDLGYHVLEVKSAEADDIIAVMTKHLSTVEKVLILSSDKDFLQLHVNDNVVQYSIARRDYIECDSPKNFLMEHIIKGCDGDGIPNIFTPLKFFYNKDQNPAQKSKQKSVYTKDLEVWLAVGHPEKIGEWDEDVRKRYKQNRALIDFECIPKKLESRIIDGYDAIMAKKPVKLGFKESSKFSDYFVRHGLDQLMSSMSEL